MENSDPRKRHNAQQRYRRTQHQKGLVRFEIQVSADTKARFDEAVDAVADEFIKPWSERQRLAKARARVFDEMTQGIRHEFFTLKEQITTLKAEIKALSPSFFQTNDKLTTPLPEAISALPDDAQQLKRLLAGQFRELQQAKLDAQKYKQQAKQFEALYNAIYQQNEELEQQLNELS